MAAGPYRSRRTDSGWGAAERVDLGGEFSDLYPTLSHDGRRLAFTSYRPFPGDTSAHPNANLWYADRRGDGWTTPVPIAAAVRPGYYHSQVWFGPGDSLIFRATTPDWATTTTLVTVWAGSEYAPPVPYEPVERWVGWRPDLYVWGGVPGPHGSVVLEVSLLAEDGRRRGPTDLWLAARRDGRWTVVASSSCATFLRSTWSRSPRLPRHPEAIVRRFHSLASAAPALLAGALACAGATNSEGARALAPRRPGRASRRSAAARRAASKRSAR